MQPGDEHDGVVAGRQDRPGGFGEVEFGGDRIVVSMDRFHHREKGDHGQDREPGAVSDFGVQDDDKHDRGAYGAEGVDEPGDPHPPAALGWAVRDGAVPMPDHAGLAEGEAGEYADDVELDELVDVGVEADDQRYRAPAEQDDAVAEDQLVAAGMHLSGQVAVFGEDRGQHREAVERGVGGEDEDGGGGGLIDVEQDRVAAEHGRRRSAR